MIKPKLSTLETLYTASHVEEQKKRYNQAIEGFKEHFGGIGEFRIFSAPGRTEIGGNHTDHNCGKVFAASVNLDVIAIVEMTNEKNITVKSEGFPVDSIDINFLEPVEHEKNTSAALIRGVAKGFVKSGFKIGGFRAYTTSNVMKGSGLSSSAAFEVLIGTILCYLYNEGKISPVKIAQISQFAENKFFGKPSGLMDQMASSVGGFVAIDFKDTTAPVIENLNVDFNAYGHSLCIIDAKGDHADLTDEYSSIPKEMKDIADYFSCDHLRQITRADIILNIAKLRELYGDRAVLRAIHFFDENDRVDRLVHALKNNSFNDFLANINESGNSSFKYLQNIYASSDVKHQCLSVALNLAESVLKRKGACRVHGGGFAGTIQAFVPLDMLKEFKMNIEGCFGSNSCHILTVRPVGGTEVKLS